MSSPEADRLDDALVLRVRKRLSRLCEQALDESWVAEVAGTLLLRMASVRRVADDKKITATQALIEVIREEVKAIGDNVPHAVILTIVLATDPQYLGMSASERQRIAAETFRGGGRPVRPATLRKYHLPKAQLRLARRLVRREQEEQRRSGST